jgi:Fur family ferric uptake transcriptional regulator
MDQETERTDREEELGNLLQRKGYRLTRARRAILSALIESGDHITADELVELVHREAPGVGRMTVYRTLDLLQRLGLVQPLPQNTLAAQYVLMDEGHHHHLICSRCTRVFEFDHCLAGEMAEALSDHFDFQIHSHLLEFYGLCRYCRQKTDTGGGR